MSLRSLHRAVVLLLLAAVATAQSGRLRLGEVELEGPLRGLQAECGGGDRLRLAGELAAGERLQLVVPVPWRAVRGDEAPAFTWTIDEDQARGRVRWRGWRATEDPAARVPSALRSRARPPVGADRHTLGLGALGVLAAGAALLGALRRRVALALGAAVLGAALAAALVEVEPAEVPDGVVVIEGSADAAQAWSRRSHFGHATVGEADALAQLVLETEPAEVALEVVHDLRAQAPTRLAAPGARLHLCAVVPAPALGPGLERNPGEDFEAAWWRAEGEWRRLGAWPSGAARPAGQPGLDAPGWLATGLPQGRGVLLARLRAGGGLRYLRWVGGD